MLRRLNHVAIAVPDLDAAVALYRDTLGAAVSAPLDLPDHGVTVVFVDLPGSKVELLHPLTDRSPIAAFLSRHPQGGLHHVCYEVEDLGEACKRLVKAGLRVSDGGRPKVGAHGRLVVFLHPKDVAGTLIELEEVRSDNADPELGEK